MLYRIMAVSYTHLAGMVGELLGEPRQRREILLHIIVVVPAQVLQLQLTGGVVVLLAAGGVLPVVLPPFQRCLLYTSRCV